MSKYKSQKVKVGGDVFDSKKEYNRWCELRLLEKAGKITDLERQVKFELIPAQRRSVFTGEYYKNNSKKARAGEPIMKEITIERACNYFADFVYKENGRKVVEDTKSKATKTEAYKIKRKLMLHLYGIKIREV